MNLPVIETPKYKLTIPSTKQTISFRPFLVKEEKLLLIAQQSEDANENIQAIGDVISSCTFGDASFEALTPSDLEYVFLQIRAKSVGETADIELECKSCKVNNPIKVNLNDAIVKEGKKVKNKIMLTDNVGVVLKPLTTADITKIESVNNQVDQLTHTIIASIDNIFDDSTVHNMTDVSYEEAEKFINSLNRSQMAKIEEYLENMPKLSMDISFTCVSCGEKNQITLEGLSNFLG